MPHTPMILLLTTHTHGYVIIYNDREKAGWLVSVHHQTSDLKRKVEEQGRVDTRGFSLCHVLLHNLDCPFGRDVRAVVPFQLRTLRSARGAGNGRGKDKITPRNFWFR